MDLISPNFIATDGRIDLIGIKVRHALIIWLVGVTFVLFQFFLQLSSGVVIGEIMVELQWSALRAGLLSSAFYYVYTALQIPVGLLFDAKDTRNLLVFNALICSFGCFVFALGHGFSVLVIGRLLMGFGSAFAFVGLSHLLRQHFPLKQFAFMIGLSETLGFVVTMFGMISMGILIAQFGWRVFLNLAGLGGIMIAFLCWYFIPQTKAHHSARNTGLGQILKNPLLWANGVYAGLSFAVITVFGALWAIPFLQLKLNCGVREASVLGAMIFLGAGLSCPLFGLLSHYFTNRRRLMILSCWSTAFFMLLILFLPSQNSLLVALIMFVIGLCCGAYMLAYTISNELALPQQRSTCAGFTNTLAMLTAPLLQPLVGFILDRHAHLGILTVVDYQYALLVIPLSLILASLLVLSLPEKSLES